jgi:transmembrane sensor
VERPGLKPLIRRSTEIRAKMTDRESSEDIDHAAAGWAARLDGAPLSADETLALEAWASTDSRRRGALARALAVLAHFDGATVLRPDRPPRRARAHGRTALGST